VEKNLTTEAQRAQRHDWISRPFGELNYKKYFLRAVMPS
jgi:hypothetical protein